MVSADSIRWWRSRASGLVNKSVRLSVDETCSISMSPECGSSRI